MLQYPVQLRCHLFVYITLSTKVRVSVHSTTPSHVSCHLVCLGLSVNPVQYARANTLTPMFALMVFYFRWPTMTTVLPNHNKLVLYHHLSQNIKLGGLYYFCINPTRVFLWNNLPQLNKLWFFQELQLKRW